VIRSNEYDFPGPAQACAVSGAELRPGDRYFAALFERAGRFERADYAEGAWQGAPPGSIAHWKGRIRAHGQAAKPKINDERLFECFDHLAAPEDPGRRRFRYVVALLLMRRKKLRFEEVRKNAAGDETMILTDSRNGRRCEVVDPKMTEAESAAVQDEVLRVLG
jgi:hypothetical protein